MRLKLLLLAGLLPTVILSSSAQISNWAGVSGVPLRLNKYEKVEGTPYLAGGEWTTGTAIDSYGSKFESVPLRYNAFEDILEVKRDNVILIVDRDKLPSFSYFVKDEFGKIAEYNFKTGTQLNLPGEKGYFRVLYEHQNLKILEKVKIIQIKVTPAAYGESDYQKFMASNETYMVINGKLEKTKLNQKALMSAFPEHKDQIKEYIKSKDLDISDNSDLGEICDFIVSLDDKESR